MRYDLTDAEWSVIKPLLPMNRRGVKPRNNRRVLNDLGITHDFLQDNHSRSTRGVLRGLHYQLGHAPATLVRAVADKAPEVTIGNDAGIAAAIGQMGGVHIDRAVDEVHVDQKNKIVTTPAYMLGPGIKDVAAGIEKLVNKVLELC